MDKLQELAHFHTFLRNHFQYSVGLPPRPLFAGLSKNRTRIAVQSRSPMSWGWMWGSCQLRLGLPRPKSVSAGLSIG